MIFNCLVAGVYGQGISTLSHIIAEAAFSCGLDVQISESTFKPGSPRLEGCSALSHVRMGHEIHSPLIRREKADLMIALDAAEAVRSVGMLSPTGRMLVAKDNGKDCDAMIKYLEAYFAYPSEERLAHKNVTDWLTVISGPELAAKCGNEIASNVVIFGAALRKKFFPFVPDNLNAVIKKVIPAEHFDLNVRALKAGMELFGAETP